MVFLAGFTSCLKETPENETILVHDPQIIPFISDTTLWPQDLLTMFGEQYVNFGDTPPKLNLAFKINRQQYVSTNLDPDESPAIGSISPLPHSHRFQDQYLQISQYTHSISLGGYTVENEIDSVYITGHDSLFTVYFHETFKNDGSPTHAVIMSGTLVDRGVINYRYGYKIVNYSDTIVPPNAYPLNSIFIFQNPDSLAVFVP